MLSGTHVGVIVSGTVPTPALAIEIRRALEVVSDADPLPPLVFHRGVRKGFDDVGADYVRSLDQWTVVNGGGGNAEIASNCHILIVIASGTEEDPTPRSSDIWALMKRARSSGRMIVHIPLVAVMPKGEAKIVKAPEKSTAWAVRQGRDDRAAGKVSPKYTRFREAHGLPDSPGSLKLWQEYKISAGADKRQKARVGTSAQKVVTPAQRASVYAKAPRSGVMRVPPPRSRPNPRGTVPLTPDNEALFRTVNPPDPDVWR